MSRGKGKRTVILEGQLYRIVNEVLKDEWPLTVRQVYYQMVAALYLENELKEYTKVSKRLTAMRREGLLPWECVVDNTRQTSLKRGVANVDEYIKQKFDGYFLRDYARCLVQQEGNYVEVWTEKDALASIFRDVCWPYCVRVQTCKGQLSATVISEYAARVQNHLKQGRNLLILHGGDLDPTGVQIPLSVQDKLKRFHDVDVLVDRFALTTEQIANHSLPINPKAAKVKDPNYKRFVEKYGTLAVELDALHPEILRQEIETALRKHLDIETMLAEQDVQKEEQEYLNKLRREILPVLRKYGHAV